MRCVPRYLLEKVIKKAVVEGEKKEIAGNQGCHHSPSRKSDQRYRTVLCKEFDGFGFRINDFGGEARRGPIFLATGGICNKLTGAAQINNVGVGVAKSDFPQHGSTRRGV